jgi:hypothetical protein
MLPMFKVGALAIKTAAKPIAKRLKDRAVDHPGFKRLSEIKNLKKRKKKKNDPTVSTHLNKKKKKKKKKKKHAPKHKHRFCVGTAQLYNRVEFRLSNFGTWRAGGQAKPLSELSAVSLGADILSETFLLSVGIGVLAADQARSSLKDDRKERRYEESVRQVEILVDEVAALRRTVRFLLDQQGLEEPPPPPPEASGGIGPPQSPEDLAAQRALETAEIRRWWWRW